MWTADSTCTEEHLSATPTIHSMRSSMSVATTSTRELLETPVLKSAISKASRRLMPMLVLLYVVAFLDRTNVGFAEAALHVDKGITAGAYALGAGIFFIGYALFEIPSNLLLTKY